MISEKTIELFRTRQYCKERGGKYEDGGYCSILDYSHKIQLNPLRTDFNGVRHYHHAPSIFEEANPSSPYKKWGESNKLIPAWVDNDEEIIIHQDNYLTIVLLRDHSIDIYPTLELYEEAIANYEQYSQWDYVDEICEYMVCNGWSMDNDGAGFSLGQDNLDDNDCWLYGWNDDRYALRFWHVEMLIQGKVNFSYYEGESATLEHQA